MNFAVIYEFCEEMARALVSLIQPIITIFGWRLIDFFDFMLNIVPPFSPIHASMVAVMTAITALAPNIVNMSLLVFLFGSGITIYVAFTLVKWVIDIFL